jgi:hypothetical protein
MADMKLFEFTTVTAEDGKRLALAYARVADHRDPTEQKEWITFQLAIDLPIGQTGATLRKIVLTKAHETLFQLASDFERLAHQSPP